MYATWISRTPRGTSTGTYTKSGAPGGSVPLTVFVAFVPSAGVRPSAALAKLTLLNVSAVAAPVTNSARLPMPVVVWSSSHMLRLPGSCDVPSVTWVVHATLVLSRELPCKGRGSESYVCPPGESMDS
ncbi:hypothetical protein GCM10009646_37380 [Streptomyces aureus]